MNKKRPHLVVEGSRGDFKEFQQTFPEFSKKITDLELFGSEEWAFIVNVGENFDNTVQEDDIMDFLVEYYIELGYLRENHAVEMSAVAYISNSHPAGMLSFDPEVIGLCAGLSIQLQVLPA